MNFGKEGNLFVPKNLVRGGFRKWMEGSMELPKIGLKGRFKVELIDRSGHIVRKLKFDNLITNAGLDAIGAAFTPLSQMAYAAVGTGSTAPTNGDTTLGAEIAPSSSNRTSDNGGIVDTNVYTATLPDFWTRTKTYLFDFTQANGNLTEIGLFSASSVGTMWTRQLLKDGGGVPTTIVKTSAFQLRVTYTIYTLIPQADVNGSVLISAVSYTTVVRPSLVTGFSSFGDIISSGIGVTYGGQAFSGAIGLRTSGPTGTATLSSSATNLAYVNGNKYLDITANWSAAVANYSIPAIRFGYVLNFLYQVGFTPSIPKTNTNALALEYRIGWDRA